MVGKQLRMGKIFYSFFFWKLNLNEREEYVNKNAYFFSNFLCILYYENDYQGYRDGSMGKVHGMQIKFLSPTPILSVGCFGTYIIAQGLSTKTGE